MSVTRYTLLYPAQNAPDLIHQIARALASGGEIILDLDEDHGAINLRVNDGSAVSLSKEKS